MLPLLPVAAAIVCVVTGPATSATRNPATPVITVNGAVYTARDFDRLYVFRQWYYEIKRKDEDYRSKAPDAAAALRLKMVRELVERQLLVREAQRRKLIVTDAEIEAAIASLRKEFKSEAVFVTELAKHGLSLADARTTARETVLLYKAVDALTAHVAVTRPEVAAYYQAHQQDFRDADEVWIAILTVEDGETARQLLAELRAGAPFEETGRKYAAATDGRVKVGRGSYTRGVWPAAFEAVAFGLKPGEISDVVKTEDAYYILLGEGYKPARQQTLEEAESSIRRILLDQHRARARQAWIDQQLAKASITYAPGFGPQGAPGPDRR
jgi:parvulin-like peptidyl-prolyl isomerase